MTPVVIDLETRSACDLKVAGSIRYATDPTTRLLTVAWTPDMGETYHVWMPGLETITDEWRDTHLKGVVVHLRDGDLIPDALAAVADRPWVGHNVHGFDRHVWASCGPDEAQPPRWIDTYPLALSVGLPGGLGKIGERLWGGGKYIEGVKALKTAMVADGLGNCEPVNVPVTQQLLVARYNVQDVRLNVDLYRLLCRECVQPDFEKRVLACHHAINHRGVRLDRRLAIALDRLDAECRLNAVTRIAALTEGALPDRAAVQSRVRVLRWLNDNGVTIGDPLKPSLRRDLVQRYIESHDDDEKEAAPGPDDDGDADAPIPTGVSRIVKVLELRLQAIRTTGGKLAAALGAMDADDRVRYMFAYWAAHTGRWAGRRLQPHNFPRPKEGVDVWGLLGHFADTGTLSYDHVLSTLPTDRTLYRFLTPDDAGSALLRSLFIPDDGDTFAAADLANIEARVLAWLAEERWLMAAFEAGDDPYMKMAVRIFGPLAAWPKFPDPKSPGAFLPLKKHPFRQVGKVVVLGCGYQLGAVKFASYAAAAGIDLDAVGTTAKTCIEAYRTLHPKIAGERREWEGHVYFRGGFWDSLNDAAVAAVANGWSHVPVGRIAFGMSGGHLIVTLPSGRRLVYRSARLKKRDWYGKTLDVVEYVSPRFGWTSMYGGKWAENVVQAVSRDVMAHGMVLAEENPLTPVVLHVHDEVGSSTHEDAFPGFMSALTTPPDWLDAFPLDAEGSCAPRYAKSPPPGVKDVVYRNGRPYK